MKSHLHLIRARRGYPLVWAVVFGIVGGAVLLLARAATPFVALEPEQGTRSGDVTSIADAQAGGGSYLMFQSGSAVTPGQWQSINPPLAMTDFGTRVIGIAPGTPSTIYVGTSYEGVWKTTDGGATWNETNHLLGGGVTCGGQTPSLRSGKTWALAVDPRNANVVYAAAGTSCEQGLWKSSDGGATWRQTMPFSLKQQTTGDIYHIEVDPSNSNHIIASFHYYWNGTGPSGMIESYDAGTTWRVVQPGADWGTGTYVMFLKNSTTWLMATQSNGFYRTIDSGTTWQSVFVEEQMTHGGTGAYISPTTGNIYIGTTKSVLRSTDGGASWTRVFSSPCSDGIQSVVGDGQKLYVAHSFATRQSTCGSSRFYVASENNDTQWSQYNSQTFLNGTMSTAFDPINRVVYSSMWGAGVWKLQL